MDWEMKDHASADRSLRDIHPRRDYKRAGIGGGFVHGITQCERELDIVINHTEDEFLSLGSVLRDFYDRARKISEMSSAVTTHMTGSEIVGSMDDLNGLLERMETSLRSSESETESSTAKLREILGLMDGIYGPLEDVLTITKTLKSLAITARVQYSSLVIKNVEMKVLLDDIKKLSEVMTEKSNNIRQDLKSLEICIEQTLSRLSVFEGEQQGRARTVLDRAMSVLCSITGQYGLSRKAAQDIADRSGAISRSTGEIVTSVQFHDITRQRFERVKMTLHQLREKSLSIADREVFGEGDGGGADTLAGAADLCACEAMEVSSIRDEFVTAVEGIIDNLRNIAVNVLAISADTKKIVGLDGANRKTFLTEAETLLSLVTASFAALSENGDASKELSQILLSLTDATAETARFIGGIEEIAEDIELIAFNTEIKSSQIGKEGSSFEIVAESIQRLSAETCTRAKEVSGTLKTITSAADGLSVATGRDFGAPSSGMEGISTDFERLITTFSRLNGNIVSLFTGIERTGHVLSGDIERVADRIDVHAVVDRVAKKIVSSLNDTALHAGALPSAEQASAPGWAGTVAIRPDRAGGNGTGVGNDGTHDGVEFF